MWAMTCISANTKAPKQTILSQFHQLPTVTTYYTYKLSSQFPYKMPLSWSSCVKAEEAGILLTVQKTLVQQAVIVNYLPLLTYYKLSC